MLHKKIALLAGICLLFLAARSAAQSVAQDDMQRLQAMEDSMLTNADSMYSAYIPELRIEHCERFVKQLIAALKIPNSYSYPFPKLQEKINIIPSDDNAFRIFNWSIPLSEVTGRYYGAIQMPGEQLKLYGLVDHSSELGKGLEDSILTNNRWFGAVYYRIMSHDVNGKKVYTLFGVNSSNPLSTRKVLEPMTFTPHGIVFGAPIFNVRLEGHQGKQINRFLLEYKKGVQVQLNWNDEEHMIIYDKLVSSINDPNRRYTYVPSGEYDGLRWGNGMWNYVPQTMPAINLGDGRAPSDKDPVR